MGNGNFKATEMMHAAVELDRSTARGDAVEDEEEAEDTATPRSNYHRFTSRRRKCTQQELSAFGVLTFLLAFFIVLGGLTIVKLQTTDVTDGLERRLVNLERELLLTGMSRYQAYSAAIVALVSNDTMTLERATTTWPDNPLANLEDFEVDYRRARRKVGSLPAHEFKHFKEAYQNVVRVLDDTTGAFAWDNDEDALETLLAVLRGSPPPPPPGDDDGGTGLATTAAADEELTIAMRDYDSANDALKRRIRTTSLGVEVTHAVLAVSSSVVAVTLFIVFACVWHKAILEARKAEEAERKTEAAVRARDALIDGIGCAGVPGFIVDANAEVIDVNPAVINTFGFGKDELVGKDINCILVSANRLPHTPRASSRGRQVSGRDICGNQIQLVCHTTRTVDVDGKKRYLIVCQDITELLHKHDELEIQKKVLSQFTHELRNKYTPAAHMLEHIFQNLSTKPATELKSELSAIQDDVRLSVALLHEADQLIATRLELHKVYSGNYVSAPNIQTIELESLMKGRVEGAGALARNDVNFVSENASRFRGDIFVRLDLYMFNHISNNLLSNARKHTFYGSVRLRFLEEANGMLHFAVLDSGRGIPESIADRLFKEEVCSADVRGVGLGLVSCRKFAEAIKGSVWLQETKVCSLEDSTGGTEFRFCLPGRIVKVDAKVDAATTYDAPSRTPSPKPNLPSSVTVYVVEDSPLIRKSIIAKMRAVARTSQQATWNFHEHETVESILPAVEDISRDPDSIITVDHNLDSCGGQLRGSDLITALKRAGFRGVIISNTPGSVPTFVSASYPSPEYKNFSILAGRSHHISELLGFAFACKHPKIIPDSLPALDDHYHHRSRAKLPFSQPSCLAPSS
ncbi:hypothetical protein CTAYLR_000996 [Chrysophaeum taylorii]|uniref:histidine kinase n=1 Tax=Chrysophaeum taylorii TaxID=2483200 RepID=A0AAD7UHH0_9STRA|nr:hypothetical protein CTAYLR_000996 [Chrysophaeum taylorii]